MIPSPAALQGMMGGGQQGPAAPQIPKEPTLKANFDIPVPVVEALLKMIGMRGGMGVGMPGGGPGAAGPGSPPPQMPPMPMGAM